MHYELQRVARLDTRTNIEKWDTVSKHRTARTALAAGARTVRREHAAQHGTTFARDYRQLFLTADNYRVVKIFAGRVTDVIGCPVF